MSNPVAQMKMSHLMTSPVVNLMPSGTISEMGSVATRTFDLVSVSRYPFPGVGRRQPTLNVGIRCLSSGLLSPNFVFISLVENRKASACSALSLRIYQHQICQWLRILGCRQSNETYKFEARVQLSFHLFSVFQILVRICSELVLLLFAD